jgi:hypothetical protein
MAELGVLPATRSNVDWSAVFAGAVIATAFGLILLAFGAALGLSVTTPYEGDDALSPVAYAVAAGLYLLWVQLLSFSLGGYVAARLRARTNDVTEHEIDVRDGMHGALVWGTGVIAAAIIAFAGLSGANAAARMPDMRSVTSAVTHVVDENVAEGAAAEGAKSAPAAAAPNDERRAEVARKLTVISGFITAASLLAGLVAAFFFAGVGGRHRDDGKEVRLFVLRKHSALW